ncbi:PP2C domain-containing protein/FHA domain-containing protein [Cephalotus follicularis]|uniref:protein-serine/threonine phosphatase n=1 Tax=Cephalotus follicularis TaxID=3775 RepID=A0A1Q3CZP8_CEPFO|nr:PP2C domain-containing protein/FHA domain-containing protein [Cephalotus follicularis]
MAMLALHSIVAVTLLLMLILIIILIVLACKPWRFFLSSSSSFSSPFLKVGDLERPLVSDDVDLVRDQSNEVSRSYDLERACFQNEGVLRSPRTHGLVHKQRIPSTSPQLNQGDSVVLDVISDLSEDLLVGQTLRPLVTDHLPGVQKHSRVEEQSSNLKYGLKSDRFQEFTPKVISEKRCCLSLEVISGPSRGLRCSAQSTSASRLPLTIGRVSPSDLLLEDSEISGKHALISWNSNKMKWELVDMGSLNGTLLNSQPINHPDSGSRHWGDPIELASGDIITLGTTSNVYVHITSHDECQIPFGVGIASDPMALRRGGKKLPMEDVCYYHWPLPGTDQPSLQFGLFGICDGHGGSGAAKTASKILPEMVATMLSDSLKRERVLSQCDASDVLRNAISQTEARMNHHHYEGCTATVLLIWVDGDENIFVQCANVGDSACVMKVDGKQIKMTEDHRITSFHERLRINETGEPLKEGETRFFGLNLGRMLGDNFLKQQEARFSSEPYISQVVHINQASNAFVLLASDGFWDVISVKKAVQLVNQARERYSTNTENLAEKIANFLLSEARTLRTKDNTTIVFLDFDSTYRIPSCKVDS